MNITPVRIYINGNGSISFYGPNNVLITNLQNLNGAKATDGQIIFDGDDKTISFYVYQLTAIESATFSLPYSVLDSRFFNPSTYSSKLNEVYRDIAEYVLVNKNGGASFVGGVVAVYPNYASFPATGQEAVIYIDESLNHAYFWDGTSYQLLVSTGVEQYASFALFPITGSANVIYIDMSVPEPYVWNGAAYVSMGGGSAVWGGITGTLSAQTDLQSALDAKFDDPTGTSADYLDGTGTPTTFPTITSGTVTSVGTTGLISGGPITGSGTITTSMATNKLVGRSTAGTGIMEEVTIGSGLTLTGAGILNNTATPTPTGYYGAFQDNTRQLAAAINTPYAVKLNTTDLSDGITIVNNGSGDPTRITIANTGIYNIQFSLQLEKSGGSGNMTADIWLRKNGVDVPSTTGKVVLTGSASASPVIAAWNYVLDVVGGNYYELMWAVSNIHIEIFAEAATPPHPATPSAILTVTQQAGIMAGTGITAINSLTGAAQTLATNGSGTDFNIVSTGTTHTFNLPTASAANRGALSSADWTTFNSKLSGLTVGTTPITSGTVGRVLFEGTGNVLQESANLFWDNTNSRLGIGTASPISTLHVQGNYAGGDDNLIPQLRFQNSNTNSSVNLYALAKVLVGNGFGGGYPELWVQARRHSDNTGSCSLRVVSNHPLIFETNNTDRGRFFANGNFAIGTTTDAGYKLDVNGTARVQGILTTTADARINTLTIGLGGGQVSTNIALGLNALGDNTTGYDNTAIGTQALGDNTIGEASTAVGYYALQKNTTGNNNSAFGYASLLNNLTASNHTASGTSSLRNLTSGSYNTAFGVNAARYIADGATNLTTSSTSIFIGSLTKPLANSQTNQIVIGYDATGLGSNSVVLGNSSITLTALRGNVLIGTTTDAGYRLDVNGTARVSGTTTITPATLTGATATSALDIAQTWNTTGTPIALKVNITDTASNALSDLISLQVGGTPRFRILKSGFFALNGSGEISGSTVIGGTGINASSQLEVRSTTKGFLPPRMTTTQKNAIATPAAGLVVYDTTLGKLCVRGAAAWETITSV